MDLIFNELSFFPYAENSHIAEENFKIFLRSFRAAREKYGFAHIRFPIEYSVQQVTTTQNFAEWISTISSPIIKNLILDLVKSPFIDDLEDSESDQFIESHFKVSNAECPTEDSPFGLPIALIKEVPSISLNTSDFWKQTKIKIEEQQTDEINEVYNISNEVDTVSKDLIEWADNFYSLKIETPDQLGIYLSYEKYEHIFSNAFLEQLFEWKFQDIDTYKYILQLMKDVESHPFTGGMGQTENLKKRGKEASKRITHEDRLSYMLSDDIVHFIACKGHYEFH